MKKNCLDIKNTLEMNLDKNLSLCCLSRAGQDAGFTILIINLVHRLSLIIHSSFAGQLNFSLCENEDSTLRFGAYGNKLAFRLSQNSLIFSFDCEISAKSSDAEKGLKENDDRHHKNCRSPWVLKCLPKSWLRPFFIVIFTFFPIYDLYL